MLDRPRLVLASTSPYRRELLRRIVEDFEPMSPGVDESAKPDEPARDLAIRLARAKAEAVQRSHPDAIVIGSDQTTELDGRCLGKPGSAHAARAQLQASSGRTVVFHTALCVVAPGDAMHEAIDRTSARFRSLSPTEINRYVEREQPFDCAGSFKVEGLGISLFDAIESSDPTALIGLPLIATCRLLRLAGIDPLAS